jgi:hypothetical protein
VRPHQKSWRRLTIIADPMGATGKRQKRRWELVGPKRHTYTLARLSKVIPMPSTTFVYSTYNGAGKVAVNDPNGYPIHSAAYHFEAADVPVHTGEQGSLLELVRRAGLLLLQQGQRADSQITENNAAWPAVEADTKALLLQLADEFYAYAVAPPAPDVVVKPPPQNDQWPG